MLDPALVVIPPGQTTQNEGLPTALICSGCFAEGVLEAEIDEYTPLAAAGTDTDRHRDARNDLQPAGQIVRPADSGTQVQDAGPRGLPRPHHLLEAVQRGLEEGVEIPLGEKHDALPEAISHSVGTVAFRVPRPPHGGS